MEGRLERGGSTTTCAGTPRQQQPGSQRTSTPPPPANARARAGGSTRGPHAAPPPAPQARGGRSGLTVMQQQQRTPASPPTISQRARHAFSIYCECVAAGQWARLTIKQRPEGETFHVSSRPLAAAPPAAARAARSKEKKRRRPNMKRLAAKQLWRESRGSRAAAAAPRQQQQQQRFSQPAVAATAASGTYAQVAALPASPAKAAASSVAAHIGSLVSSPRLTRAAKKRKERSPGDMDVAVLALAQLDGMRSGCCPPLGTSPQHQLSSAPASRTTPRRRTRRTPLPASAPGQLTASRSTRHHLHHGRSTCPATGTGLSVDFALLHHTATGPSTRASPAQESNVNHITVCYTS